MKSKTNIRTATALAVACSALFSGCEAQLHVKSGQISDTGRFGAEPAGPALNGDIWSNKDGHENFYATDKSGQVFNLVQCRTNTNLYTVWRMQGETNGLR